MDSVRTQALFFASIHLYDAGDANFGQFYPGSGAADVLALNAINVPVTPMWRRKAGHAMPPPTARNPSPAPQPQPSPWPQPGGPRGQGREPP